jgi:uncharacterized membrane protein YbhN (UPF0104 family)
MTAAPNPEPARPEAPRGGAAAPPRRRVRPVALLNVAFLLIGAALLTALILKLDTAQIAARIRQVGWGMFAVVCLYYPLGLLVTTAAWRHTIDPARSRARFRDLLAAFWAGAALNAVTPGGSLGEVWRGTIMRGKVDSDEIVASLVIFNFMSTVSMLLFNLLGPLLCLALLDLPHKTVGAVFAIALAFMIPWVVVYLLLRRGAVGLLVRLIGKLPLVRLRNPEALQARARTVDVRIREFRARRPRDFWLTVLWLAVARVVQAADYLPLLLVLVPGRPVWWLVLVAFLTQTAAQLLSWALAMIPSGIGAQEFNSMKLYGLLGLDPVVGFTMEVIRHIRMPLGIAVGLVLGWIVGARRPAPAEAPADARQGGSEG